LPDPVAEVVYPPMQFNTAPAGLFDVAPVRANFSSMYFPSAPAPRPKAIFQPDGSVEYFHPSDDLAPLGNHTHQIDLDRSPKHDMGALRFRTAQEFKLTLAQVDEMSDAEIVGRTLNMGRGDGFRWNRKVGTGIEHHEDGTTTIHIE
jgi:hypothetical protein